MDSIASYFSIAPYDWHAVGAAILCGTIIGIERQIRGKPVGIRTSSLIVLGTYLFLATSGLLTGNALDPSRVVGQVITGVGFLGAGVMLSKDGSVIGVTSAAAIWVLAAMGVMISMGYYSHAIKMAVLVVCLLWGVDILEDNTVAMSKGVYSRMKKRRSIAKAKAHRSIRRGDD